MNRKITRLIQPKLQLYFGALVVFAVISAFFNIWLGLAEGAAALGLYLYSRSASHKRKKEVLRYLDTVNGNVDAAARDTMTNAPMPMVIFRPESGEVVWSNDRFLKMLGSEEALFDTRLDEAVPQFDARWLMEGKNQCPAEVAVGGRRYVVYGSLARVEGKGGGFLATTYWMDVTDYSVAREEFQRTRPVVAIVMLDNYEELMKNLPEASRSALRSQLDVKLAEWTAPTGGMTCRYDRDRYLFVFEEQYLAGFIEKKFDLLETVRNVPNPGGLQPTVSIGVGKDADSFQELFQYASLSIEMALSRGGDQAVIKNRFDFEFYGGRAKETEKRTKVKSRVMANALSELVADSSRVLVMGHKFPDLDAFGAAVGVCALARKRGVRAAIVAAPEPNPASPMYARMRQQPEYEHCFISAQEAMEEADGRTLLVVVDTNRPEQVESEPLLESVNRVAVIDHHRRAATYIANAALNFHEPYASSASELVTELLQYIVEPSDLLRTEAEALLAGVVLDTKNFTMRTGARTFEAAAFLRRCGADTAEVKKLFQNDLEGTISRYDIIRNARMYRDDIAVAKVDHTVGRVTAAQAADELLNISGIDTSFVLFPDGDRVIVSARSMGDTNVQVILEKLGGGGNAATAGAQIPGMTVDEATRALLRAIDQYFEDED